MVSKRIDRLFGDLGRYAKTPTSDAKTRRRVDDMLTDLYDGERRNWPVLKGLIDGRLDTMVVYEAWKGGRPIPTVEEIETATAAVSRWLPSVENEKTREGYEWALNRLIADSGASLADLPKLLEDYRRTSEQDGRRRTFNLTRSAVQALLRDTVGRGAGQYSMVTSLRPLRLERRIGGAVSPEAVRRYAEELGPHGEMLWDLCLTGMRRGEYFPLQWKQTDERIEVYGTKTEGSLRYVPPARTLAGPTAGYDWFAHALRRVSGGSMRVHDARKTFAHWFEEAGLPRTRLRMYLGHGRRDVTDIYTEHDVRRFLKPDAELLKSFVGSHSNSHPAPIAQLAEQLTLNQLQKPAPQDEESPISRHLARFGPRSHTKTHTHE